MIITDALLFHVGLVLAIILFFVFIVTQLAFRKKKRQLEEKLTEEFGPIGTEDTLT